MLEFFKQNIEIIKQQVKGLKSMALINIEDGSVLISEPANNKDVVHAAVFQAEIYKQAIRSLTMVNDSNTSKKVSEILITTQKDTYIISTASGKFLGIMVVDTEKANLGICRAIIGKLKMQIAEMLKQNLG